MTRPNVIHIRLNSRELEQLQQAAAQKGLSMSEVVRDFIKTQLPPLANARQTDHIPLR